MHSRLEFALLGCVGPVVDAWVEPLELPVLNDEVAEVLPDVEDSVLPVVLEDPVGVEPVTVVPVGILGVEPVPELLVIGVVLLPEPVGPVSVVPVPAEVVGPDGPVGVEPVTVLPVGILGVEPVSVLLPVTPVGVVPLKSPEVVIVGPVELVGPLVGAGPEVGTVLGMLVVGAEGTDVVGSELLAGV